MSRITWNVSAGAVVLFALTYFFDDSGVIAAMAPAAAVHELGHLLPLYLCGCPLRRVSINVFGVEMDYAGRLSGARALLCIGGGPALGLLYAVAACTLGGPYGRMSGTVSFLLSVFNLLPVLPLDGGRLVGTVASERVTRCISCGTALTLLLIGGWLCIDCRALAPLAMGAWLTIYNYRA